MRQILFAAGIALAVSILLTPVLIKAFSRQGFGQEIRVEGPQSHQAKRGTPTMGGVAILAGLWAGYWGSHLIGLAYDAEGPSASGLLVLGLTTALGGVGFLDDFIKIRKQRNLGLNKTAKLVGQLIVAVVFGILALQFRNSDGLSPASTDLSYVRDIATVSMGSIVFILFVYLLVSAWSNAVNLTDGLDGLAAGAMALVLGAYVIITFWQYRNACAVEPTAGCYDVRDPLDLALLCAAGGAACLGFLCGTRHLQRSSWATPARWPSAACSPACLSPPGPSSSWSSSVHCSSQRPPRWSSRWRSSAPADAVSSGWHRSTIISSSVGGRKPR